MGRKISYLIHLFAFWWPFWKRVRYGDYSKYYIYCLINLLVQIILVTDHFSNKIAWKMILGIAKGHFVKFGRHFEKSAPWRQTIQVYIPLN